MTNFRVAEVHHDADLTVLVVASFRMNQTRTQNACSLFVQGEPVAVVVCKPGSTQAFDMQANSIDIDELKRTVSELRQRLSGK